LLNETTTAAKAPSDIKQQSTPVGTDDEQEKMRIYYFGKYIPYKKGMNISTDNNVRLQHSGNTWYWQNAKDNNWYKFGTREALEPLLKGLRIEHYDKDMVLFLDKKKTD